MNEKKPVNMLKPSLLVLSMVLVVVALTLPDHIWQMLLDTPSYEEIAEYNKLKYSP